MFADTLALVAGAALAVALLAVVGSFPAEDQWRSAAGSGPGRMAVSLEVAASSNLAAAQTGLWLISALQDSCPACLSVLLAMTMPPLQG